jgi:hypothetical protein
MPSKYTNCSKANSLICGSSRSIICKRSTKKLIYSLVCLKMTYALLTHSWKKLKISFLMIILNLLLLQSKQHITGMQVKYQERDYVLGTRSECMQSLYLSHVPV